MNEETVKALQTFKQSAMELGIMLAERDPKGFQALMKQAERAASPSARLACADQLLAMVRDLNG